MGRVAFEHVSKVFAGPRGERIPAVQDLSVAVAERELLVLVGPSGCGKTTTLRLLAGLEQPTAGTITIDGRVVNDVEPKDRDVAMVLQNHALYPHLTVFENLAFGLKLRRFPKPEINQRVRSAADLLGLAPLFDRLPEALSGGQRQRVAVGRALVVQPRVFLFDEPLSHLDAARRGQLRLELRRLHERLGATTLYVTHDQAEAMSLGQRLVLLREGRVQQIAPPLEVYDRPANLFVAGFIGSPPMNFWRGTVEVEGDALRFRQTAGASDSGVRPLVLRVAPTHRRALETAIGKPTILGVRPEHVRLGPTRPGGPAVNEQAVLVDLVEPVCPDCLVHALVGGATCIARCASAAAPRRGETVVFRFDPENAHYFDGTSEQAIP